MVLTVVAVVLGLHLAGELILAELNRREVRRHAGAAPAAVAAIVDAPTYAKSVEYTQAKLRFGMVSQVFDTALLAAVVFGGLLPWLYAKFAPMAPAGTWDDALFIGAALVLLSIPSQPFDWWSTFRLEARFGFNKSTLQLWLGDKLKGVLLAAVIGFPLLWALLSLVLWVGRWWWLWGFALIFAFQLLMMVLYPKLILPLFNKLTPLPDGELRTRLLALADRTGFKAQTIEVIDGSKRSGHSNAYFTGFGRFRRIVLFDTLISQLTPEELEAVLAHEIGHYRRGHIPRMLAISAIIQLGALAAIAALAASGWFNPAFGFPAGEIAPAFLLFGLLSGAAMFWLTPLANLFSRKHEYEADAFAREAMGGPAPLVAALRKLAQKNLSNLTPHPWYSGFHYSHPTLVERERALTA
ncbi:MAG: Protease HtpX [Verrucomicrobia bacterium ADurb.Bin122]|nr:MAG: Protease HtpX [Verrucomicrobia bacterium ADurb.Bin122]HOD47298.1 M48 family metallopeptidase [Opitutaceae bacterium]